jgi:hypothetical protein
VGPPVAPGETQPPYPNPSVIDETGLVEACAQTDFVEPLHGAISLSNPFEADALQVMWAHTDCDSSITFTFSRTATGFSLIGDPPNSCVHNGAPLPLYIRFVTPMPADSVHAELVGVGPTDLYTPIDSVHLSSNRRQIHIGFTGAKEYAEGDRCSADYAAETDVVDGVLAVGVFISRSGTEPYPPNRVSIGCDALGYVRTLDWSLGEAFAGTHWRDLRGGPAYEFGEGPA